MPSDLIQHFFYWSGHNTSGPTSKSENLCAKCIGSDAEWFSRFSPYEKYVACCLLDASICWSLAASCTTKLLYPSELEDSLKLVVKCSQQTSLSDLYTTLVRGHVPSGTFASLSPFIHRC